MKKRYQSWVEGLNWDWCISRQRFFGIPIPIFYCQDCQRIILPKLKELPIDPRVNRKKRICPYCQSKNIKGETGVLDTWFTSALTPDINNLHPLNGPLKGKMYPMAMRPHAHDIIRSWTTYSILMGLLRHNRPPWKDIMISGHILAKKGEKISKKTGGGKYDPMELVKKYSADALRYAMCGGKLGRDVYFDENELRKGKKLVVKIFNAGRFVLSNLGGFNPKLKIDQNSLKFFDRWILFRAAKTAKKMAEKLAKYEFGGARKIFEEFFWGDFCDNYLEVVKGRIYGKEKTPKKSAQYALFHTYLAILKMAAPFLPHITEEMYHSYFKKKTLKFNLNSSDKKGYFFKYEKTPSIHLTSWPTFSDKISQINKKIKEGAELSLFVLKKIRKAKVKVAKGERKKFNQILLVCSPKRQNLLAPFLPDIKNFAKVEKIQLSDKLKSKIPSDILLISLPPNS